MLDSEVHELGTDRLLIDPILAAALPDNPHLSYIEQQPATDSGPRTALGVTDGSLEWSLGAVDAFLDRTAILGSPAITAQVGGGYSDWTSSYIANRESPNSLRLYKRTHLKNTNTTAAVTSPKPSLNFFLCARNNNGASDHFFKHRLRFASIGQAVTLDEIADYYQIVQTFQDSLGRSV